MGYLIIAFPEIYCQVCQWKNLENRLSFGKVTDKNRMVRFFVSGHGVLTCI